MKNKFALPDGMESCHLIILDDYLIEGHISVGIIKKLLDEKPEIDGILLPGMPVGTPGMPGDQQEPWIILAVTEGATTEYITIELSN